MSKMLRCLAAGCLAAGLDALMFIFRTVIEVLAFQNSPLGSLHPYSGEATPDAFCRGHPPPRLTSKGKPSFSLVGFGLDTKMRNLVWDAV